jgi:hypothetical protein
MTKLIVILVVVLVLFGGYQLFLYWDKVQHEEEVSKKTAQSAVVTPEQLSGMPQQLDASLKAAQAQGATGLANWLKKYGGSIQDPRKAWIQLDYCVLVSRQDPAEARRVFAEVKERTSPNSPVWPRIKQLEATYQ